MYLPLRRAITTAVPFALIATLAPAAPAHAAPIDLRMTAAPVAVRDASGLTWSPIGTFDGGARSFVHAARIAGTRDQNLYQYERWGMSSWSIPVPARCYDVTLKFREKYHAAAGRRVFSVDAEGTSIVRNLDIFAEVGRNRALDRTARVAVTDGRLNLSFTASVDNPLISAVRVRDAGPVEACGSTTPAPSPAPTPTPTPAPAPTPTPAPPTDPPAAPALPAQGAGPVGSAVYPVPADAVVVAPSGTDSAAGTLAAPVGTVTAALTKVSAGGTIVLRGGTYHESVLVPPGKNVTIQPYPGEAVWFDGSRVVTGFTRDARQWSTPWDTVLDASPTYTRGAPDNTEEGWRFVNPARPMAAHPDQVWIDGQAQRQVGSRDQVSAGTFFVDTRARRLVLGTDPAGKRVEAGVLPSAFSLRAPGTVLRGFGIRRYVPSVPDFGAVTSFFPRMTLENMTVVDSSTAGIGLYAPDSVVRSTTVSGSGLIGIQGNEADRLVLDRLVVRNNNTEGFNHAPVAGGLKFARVRDFTLSNSLVEQNDGIGVWLDESVYDMRIVKNTVLDNAGSGIMLELSSKAVVANNVVLRSGYDALAVRNTNNVAIWNNTLSADMRALHVSQDWRRPDTNHPHAQTARDARHLNDSEMTWVIADITIRNNVFVGGPKALMTLGVEDFDKQLDPSEQRITSDGNVYAPTSATAPRWLAAWSRPGTDPFVHTELAGFAKTNGQEQTGVSYAGENVLDGQGRLRADVAARADVVAHPLPQDVAGAAGYQAGVRHLGAHR